MFASFTTKRDEAEEYGRAWRGGIPVVFELRSAWCRRLWNGTYLLHPFAVLHVEAVAGNAVKLVEVEPLEPARIARPPGRRPGVIPKGGKVTELHAAAQLGDVRGIARFVSRPELIDRREASGWTPLAVAAKHGKTEAVKALAWLGADLNVPTNDGASPMYIAACEGHLKLVRVLGSLGANVNVPDNSGAAPVYIAAQQGHVGVVKALASLGADVNVRERSGATPVFIAAQQGHLEIVKALASVGADVTLPLVNGPTPVFVAALSGHSEVVKALASLGVEVNVRTSDGATPLFIGAGKGRLEVVKTLASFGADVNTQTDDGTTPLFIAAAADHDKMVRTLVSLGADVNLRRKNWKWSRYYIETFGMNPEESGDWTPLMIAARNGHVEVVKVLVKAGASVEVMLSDGRTALSLAIAMGHAEVAASLAAL
jgi:ankyrin repeat protein